MGRILVVALTLSVLLAAHAHGTNASRSYTKSDEVDAKFHVPVNKWNSILQFIRPSSSPEGNTTMTHIALYDEESNPDGYHGFIATMEVYGFSLKTGQGSETSFSLADPGVDPDEPRHFKPKGMTIGWHVLPDVYGDSHTHLFTLWTNDGFESTGCLNMKCPGFQPEKGASIAPGGIIQQVSAPKGTKQNLNLKIVKDGALGDWLVHVGLNKAPELIGRFPKSLFSSGLSDRAITVRFGGTATRPAPMGSGYLPTDGKRAASMSNIQFIDQKGHASLLTGSLGTMISDESAYNLSSIANGQFFYGGPWKATA